jgi:hypothetical protein
LPVVSQLGGPITHSAHGAVRHGRICTTRAICRGRVCAHSLGHVRP